MLESIKVTVFTAFTNLLVSIAKIVAGLLGNSMAVLTDGIHSFSDFATDLILIIGLKISDKPADKKYQYGYKRMENIISFSIGIGLIIVGAVFLLKSSLILYNFVFSKIYPYYKVSYFAGIVAFITFIVKFGLYKYNYYFGKKLNSQGILANSYENKSDAISSLGIAAGTLLVSFLGAKYSVIDSILSLIVSLFIIHFAISIIVTNFQIILGIGSSDKTIQEIKDCVLSNCDIVDVHNVRTRYEGENLFIDMHITVNKDISIQDGHDISCTIEKQIKEQFEDVKDVVVHLEPSSIGEENCKE